MDKDAAVRPYRPADRDFVRQISCDTAERGEPVEQFFNNRQLVADLLTRYYTDFSPHTLWVAEAEGQVVGYLTGALNTRDYRRVMFWEIVPRTVIRAVFRGLLWNPQVWRLCASGLSTFWVGGFRRKIPLNVYPAHLHVNLKEGYRGQNLGRALMEKFIDQAAKAGVPGVHAVVRGDNSASLSFFERMGFAPLSRQPVIFLEGESYKKHYTVVFGRKL